MTDSMLPILRAMYDASTEAERAEILLRCPVNIMIKYRHVMERACERAAFVAGTEYLLCFFAALHEVRHRGDIKGAALRHAQGRLLLICDEAAP